MEQPLYPPPAQKIHWPSVLQFIVSVLGLFGTWSTALGLGIFGAVSLMSGETQPSEVLMMFLLGAGMGLVGLMLLPAALYAFMRIIGRLPSLEQRLSRMPGGLGRFLPHPLVLVGAAILAIVVGHFIAQIDTVSWLILPVLHVLAIGLPLLVLTMLALRGLSLGSPQRAWGVFAAGAVIGPLIIMILEISVALLALVAWIIYIATQPGLQQELSILAMRITYAGQNPQDLTKLVRPYLMQPVVMYAVLVYVAGLVPLIEELFKPIGAWLLVGKGLTPRSGFVAGAISGAGYALYENVTLSVMGAASDWSSVVTLRIGTGLLHILTSAVTGWGLGMAWTHRRYLVLGLSYLFGVLLHSLWNTVSMVGSFSAIWKMEDTNEVNIFSLPYLILGVLVVVFLALLLSFNRRLRQADAPLQPVEAA